MSNRRKPNRPEDALPVAELVAGIAELIRKLPPGYDPNLDEIRDAWPLPQPEDAS